MTKAGREQNVLHALNKTLSLIALSYSDLNTPKWCWALHLEACLGLFPASWVIQGDKIYWHGFSAGTACMKKSVLRWRFSATLIHCCRDWCWQRSSNADKVCITTMKILQNIRLMLRFVCEETICHLWLLCHPYCSSRALGCSQITSVLLLTQERTEIIWETPPAKIKRKLFQFFKC